jgi:hypothetical protein
MLETAAEEQAVAYTTFGQMALRFDGRVGAFAYLLFVLMYFPCVAAMGAVYRETNAGWTAFVGLWTTGPGLLECRHVLPGDDLHPPSHQLNRLDCWTTNHCHQQHCGDAVVQTSTATTDVIAGKLEIPCSPISKPT